MENEGFVCHRCKREYNDADAKKFGKYQGNKVCYACCAEYDKEYMRKHGKITLYLTHQNPLKPGTVSAKEDGWRVTNWPSSLILPVFHIRKGKHNIAGSRYDVWFYFEGREWWGRQFGENTQLVHCRRTNEMPKV
jgi:hypothetical protein